MIVQRKVRLALFYTGIGVAGVGLFTLPFPHAISLAIASFGFLGMRALYGLVSMLFHAKKLVATVFGIDSARFFGWLSVTMAAVTLVFLTLPASRSVIGISFFLFLSTVDAAFHSRLQR